MRIIALALLIAYNVSLNSLTLDQKVGQMLMAHFHGEQANQESQKLIEQAHVGGILFYTWANALSSPEQVRLLCQQLQNSSTTPLFIAVDQEGGRINRLKEGFTQAPCNGSIHTPEEAGSWAALIGNELREVGINMNLAPVVDVNSNPKNPVIGDRSYGNHPEFVIDCAKQAIAAYQNHHIISVLKHYPGHGDTENDSHVSLPVVNVNQEVFQSIHLKPFKELAPEADAIMTAHLLLPLIDKHHPATVSKILLTDILRDAFDFSGIIISDSMMMKGLTSQFKSIDEACIAAINAGCDLLILGGAELIDKNPTYELTPDDVVRIHQSIVKAVKDGKISEDQINQSTERILTLKKKFI